MALLDKILNSMKYNDDDDYDDYDEEDYDDYDQRPSRASVRSIRTATMNDQDEFEGGRGARQNAKPATPTTPRAGTTRRTANGMEVCVIKPTTVNDAREITETLLSNRTVVLNMEGLDVDIAQRIIDFTSGSTFAM